ncbi:MAG: ATP-binding cassette domain-containing protein [Chloroflexota bacterium]|nr:ATP-binding cassette domain-containing protein [Chloroflexota bacterium]
MIVTDLASVTRAHGDRTIFADLSWTIEDRARIGLIGPNGSGKSTLLRTIAGVELPEGGLVTRPRDLRVAYLTQEQPPTDVPVIATLLAARPDLAAIERDLGLVGARLADPAVSGDMALLTEALEAQERLLHAFERAGGPRLRNRAEGLLRDLGIPRDHWDLPLRALSGGQRKLVGLAGCLIADPDLLLLDEPDNHLDVERKEILERLLTDFDGAVVIVSHDRYLLDDTVDQIAELEPAANGARLRVFEGNYSAYVVQKEIALRRQQQDYTSQQKEIARLEAAVKRFELWARLVVDERHIKQARNKQRQIDRMDKVERPVLERRRMALSFRPRIRGGAIALRIEHATLSFDGRPAVRDVELVIQNGERVGIIGPNGAGKTVLLSLMSGERMPDRGTVWVGPSIERGRYAQHHETLDPRRTPIETLRAVRPMTEGEAVAKLLKFLIPYAAAQQPIATLSGGEKSRMQLACLMYSNLNCLLLDEPTNNLDIASAEVLESALEEFTGTVIVVSHDRYFLDRVVDRIVAVEDGAVRLFEGSYSAYADREEPNRAKRTAAAGSSSRQ